MLFFLSCLLVALLDTKKKLALGLAALKIRVSPPNFLQGINVMDGNLDLAGDDLVK